MSIFDKFRKKKDEETVELKQNEQPTPEVKEPIQVQEEQPQYTVEECLEEIQNCYKEIDYLTAKSNYFESLYNYTKMINDPNAGNANKAYMIYENVKRWENVYKKYESM